MILKSAFLLIALLISQSSAGFSDVSFSSLNKSVNEGNSNMHDKDYISYQIPGGGINGSTYGISKVEDLNKYLES